MQSVRPRAPDSASLSLPFVTPPPPASNRSRLSLTPVPAGPGPIRRDNGFLQNPLDPTDPTPQATRPAGALDHLSYATWSVVERLIAATPRGRRMPDALALYRHFLEGSGTPLTVDYSRFLREDPGGARVLTSISEDLRRAATEAMERDPVDACTLFTSDLVRVGRSERYPYPGTENWQKTLGAHHLYAEADVSMDRTARSIHARVTLRAVDRYNFNPGDYDSGSGLPDSWNGRLEQSGLAKQFDVQGNYHYELRFPVVR